MIMRSSRPLAAILLAMGLTLMLTSCISRDDFRDLKGNQEKILAKVSVLGTQTLRPGVKPPPKVQPVAKQAAAQDPGAGAAKADPSQRRYNSPDPEKVYSFRVGDSPTQGPDDAWVTLVHVFNFQEMFSGQMAPILKDLKTQYGENLRLVFKHYPLERRTRSMPAANGSMCAHEQGKFWEFHDTLFETQFELEDTDLLGYAKTAKVDLIKWQNCYRENKYKEHILTDQRTAAILGSLGAPAFFINGRYLKGFQPTEVLQDLIETELDKAKKSGTNKAQYYQNEIVIKGRQSI
ncbi:MAG: DsbA family protein [Deltaproteobacteria bacterium]|nr:DsbA family protein [Deltaproteobacteria bacterium]MBT6431847.1 DsbA family protein [Deltaproteobacteria bacterium]MBT6491185.1 DsbA family protein [Deltaproteobacteria bacterium]